MGEANTTTNGANLHVLLQGHIGNLTSEQDKAFTTFKELLIKSNLYRPPTEDEKASHDDVTLLRFLRARGFNPIAGQKQFSDCEKWRAHHNVDKLYQEAKADDMEGAKRFYPRWTGHRDKLGIPLFVYRIASLEPVQHELEALQADIRYQRIVVLNEFLIRFIVPLCSHLPRSMPSVPISATTTIIDLEHVSFGTMWKLRHFLQEASTLTTANYPETLHSIAIVNSPSFFPTIWNWIKGWFDEGTRVKIHVLGKDPGPNLREIIHARDLPAPYGGELEWKYEDNPHLDEQAKEVLVEMPLGPVAFVDGAVSRSPP